MEIVMCIDIGTVHSGYAYSSKKEFDENPLDIHLNEEWMSGHANLHTFKTPSIVLLHPEKNLHSFGYEAERKYTQLMEAKQNDMWFYFRRFKSDWKTKQFRKDTIIGEEGGKSLNGIALYSLVLKYLKAHFLDSLEESAKYGSTEAPARDFKIKYVITVPTKWDNAARECMKSAAKKAGMTNYSVYSEGEAIGRYCRYQALKPANQSQVYIQKHGSRHVLVNIGGCSIDTVVQEVLEDGSIKEFSKNVGNSSGATKVDLDFIKFINTLFPSDFIESYSKKHKSDFLELQYEFEIKKQSFSLEMDQGTKLELPASFMKAYTAKYKQSIQFMIDDTDFVGRILSQDEYIILDKTVMKDIFGPAVKSTVGYISNLIRDPEAKQCDAIIVVGGFATSPVVNGAVKFYFPTADIVVADEPDLAVLLGGVLLGHHQDSTISITPSLSFGVGIAVPYKNNEHSKEKLFLAANKSYCCDVFQTHLGQGRKIILGDLNAFRSLTLNRPGQKTIALPVYASSTKHPKYTTDEGVVYLGKHYVDITQGNSEKTNVDVQMAFLGSSLVVEGTERGSGFMSQTFFKVIKSEREND